MGEKACLVKAAPVFEGFRSFILLYFQRFFEKSFKHSVCPTMKIRRRVTNEYLKNYVRE